MATIPVIILNYNGRRLLAECLPSVLVAAGRSRHECPVVVIDNDSTDDSVEFLRREYPEVEILRRPNRGLCSYNEVVAECGAPAAVLLNNDIKLDEPAIDPLVAPLVERADADDCFLTAPLCYRFDGTTYEGLKTAVRWRWGLVQATALYEGHQAAQNRPGLTASAGAAIAVDCRKFAALGGFDPRYLPGRLEDLDFAFRGFQAGWHARYVPDSATYHMGQATFEREFGRQGCDELALRNTLLFQWKNLRRPANVARQAVGISIRLAADLVRAPWIDRGRRCALAKALAAAVGRLARQNEWRETAAGRGDQPIAALRREREFFRTFHPRAIDAPRAA